MDLPGLMIIRQDITCAQLASVAEAGFGDMVKAMVDVSRGCGDRDSMINVRPKQNNRSRDVEDEGVRATIRRIVDTLVGDV